MKPTLTFASLLISCCLFAFPTINHANQIYNLDKLLNSRLSHNPPRSDAWTEFEVESVYTPVYIGSQYGKMEADKIGVLPGQPEGVNFDQYSGYVTVEPTAGRALFYYFVESTTDPSYKPLVLWLNGGPGCSSLGFGAMNELGPFRVNPDGKTLFRNDYAWNNVANVLFLESPAGVGFSYSNTTSDYNKMGDIITANDGYVFLVNWFERFPQYKNRDFFMTGESYSGHYVPQLAYKVLLNNKRINQTVINLKGIAIGNAWVDDYTGDLGAYDFYWAHALNSDETHMAIRTHCEGNFSTDACKTAYAPSVGEIGEVDIYNIYGPHCQNDGSNHQSVGSIHNFDPCSDRYVAVYLNLPEVQKAFHVTPTVWTNCSDLIPGWNDSPKTVLPIIKYLMDNNISVWIYSGDMDGRVPVTSSRYAVNTLKLPVETPFRPWYTNQEVGGYVVGYKGLVLTTVRGAGHLVPSYQPERALTLISSFIKGQLPPTKFG